MLCYATLGYVSYLPAGHLVTPRDACVSSPLRGGPEVCSILTRSICSSLSSDIQYAVHGVQYIYIYIYMYIYIL